MSRSAPEAKDVDGRWQRMRKIWLKVKEVDKRNTQTEGDVVVERCKNEVIMAVDEQRRCLGK